MTSFTKAKIRSHIKKFFESETKEIIEVSHLDDPVSHFFDKNTLSESFYKYACDVFNELLEKKAARMRFKMKYPRANKDGELW